MYNRLAIFHAAGLLMGINLGPLLAQVAFHRPDLVITALTGTAMIFVSFSAAALVAKRRHFLYLGGILASAISVLCTLRMLNFFMGGTLSAGLFAVELYGGLAIFMSYIIFDTQMIIEDAHTGRKDFVAHAMELLIDFVGVFVRLLIILQRNAQKKSEDERNRRR
jgi:FtsH-binding integral membrane protein